MRDVDAELLPLGIDPELKRDAPQKRVEPVAGDPAPCLGDRVGEHGLQPLPLLGERGFPVALDQVGELVTQPRGILVDEARPVRVAAEGARRRDDR